MHAETLKNHFSSLERIYQVDQSKKETLTVFKPNEAASLLAERFNMIGWIYK